MLGVSFMSGVGIQRNELGEGSLGDVLFSSSLRCSQKLCSVAGC